jgi:hypothetical protein
LRGYPILAAPVYRQVEAGQSDRQNEQSKLGVIPARRGRIRNLCGKTTGNLNLNDREIALLNHAISQPHLT